jgi:hypothetical protein
LVAPTNSESQGFCDIKNFWVNFFEKKKKQKLVKFTLEKQKNVLKFPKILVKRTIRFVRNFLKNIGEILKKMEKQV